MCRPSKSLETKGQSLAKGSNLRPKSDHFRSRWSVLVAATAFLVTWSQATLPQAVGQIVDSLDAYPPRWHLAGSDCGASVVQHLCDPAAGVAGSGCESVTLGSGIGSEAVLEYRIEPVRIIDELTARVHLRSNQRGQRVGMRVRFPYLLDPKTRTSASVIIYGADYREIGQWQMVGVGAIEKPLRLKLVALHREFGSGANLSDPFVDAVVINAYTGPGRTKLSIDNLSIDGVIPVADTRNIAATLTRGETAGKARIEPAQDPVIDDPSSTRTVQFPVGRVTRILQHNGEPLDWVRTLGFDAVLLNRPADEPILREAMRTRMGLVTPPPTAPDPQIVSLLEPVLAYYLGTSLSAPTLTATKAEAERLRNFPLAWQRPLISAPAESLAGYGAISDIVVHDLPTSLRGLGANEEVGLLQDRISRTPFRLASGLSATSGRVIGGGHAIGVQTHAPPALSRQLDRIAGSIGAPRGDDFFWHDILIQTFRALETAPRAVVYRSSRSLTSGLPEDQSRSLALSYVNRILHAVGPMAANSRSSQPLACLGPGYRCGVLEAGSNQLLIATTTRQHRGLALAGDGEALRILVRPDDAGKFAWRITHFTAERAAISVSPEGSFLEVISPDLMELVVVSSDPEMGGRLSGLLNQVAAQAASDRWQLAREAIDRLRDDWQVASGSRIVSASGGSIDLLNAATRTLVEAEPLFRGGDAGASLRMAKRADAWALKSRWSLFSALSPEGRLATNVSCPPLMTCGGVPTQLLWWPLMSESGWGVNRLSGGSLDDASMLGAAGWTFGRRTTTTATADARIARGRQIEGTGCLAAEVVPSVAAALPGGYAGTAMQIRSPSVRFAAGTAIRIEAKVRTLGFGGPDQGVLVYDNLSGQELGILVRGQPAWETVRLYRQCIDDSEVQVMFEAIGGGELMIDDVQVRAWEPNRSVSNSP